MIPADDCIFIDPYLADKPQLFVSAKEAGLDLISTIPMPGTRLVRPDAAAQHTFKQELTAKPWAEGMDPQHIKLLASAGAGGARCVVTERPEILKIAEQITQTGMRVETTTGLKNITEVMQDLNQEI